MKTRESEIRKLLGNRFHLCVNYDENLKISEWHLYRNYRESKVYFSSDNVEIMNNKTNTVDELYEFAKNHHKIDEHFTLGTIMIYVAMIAMIITMFNIIFLKSSFIRWFIYGVEFMIIFVCLITHYIWNKNWKVDMLELKEEIKKIDDELCKKNK